MCIRDSEYAASDVRLYATTGVAIMERTFATMTDIINTAYATAIKLGAKIASVGFGVTSKGIDYKSLSGISGKSFATARESITDQLKQLIAAYGKQRAKESNTSKPTTTGATDPCGDPPYSEDGEDGPEAPMTLGDPLPADQKAKCTSRILSAKRFMNVRKRRASGKVIGPSGICIHESASHGTGGRTAKYLATRGYGVHFVVEKTGAVYQHNPITDKLIHGGNANSRFVGVECPSRFAALDKQRIPWTVGKGKSKDKRVWRYPNGFITRKIKKAILAGEAGVSFKISADAKTFGKRGFIFNPPKQCEAFWNLCTCLFKKGISKRIYGYDAKIQDWSSKNVDISAGGVVPHTRVPGTSHGDGRFFECYIKYRILGYGPKKAYNSTVGSLLMNTGKLSDHSALGANYLSSFPAILSKVYGGDVHTALAMKSYAEELDSKDRKASEALAKKVAEQKKFGVVPEEEPGSKCQPGMKWHAASAVCLDEGNPLFDAG